jgi:diguanylate cyclase (GGDEF)-like protein
MVSSDGTAGGDAPDPVPDQAAATILRWLGGTVSGLLLALAGLAAATTDGSGRVVLTVLSALAAVLTGGLGVLGRPTRRSSVGVQAEVAVLAVAPAVVGSGFLWVTGQPWQIAPILLAVVIAGAGLPDLRWFSGVLTAAWTAGIVGVVGAHLGGAMGEQPALAPWVHGAIALAAASMLSTTIREVRVEAIHTLIDVHRQADDETVRDALTGVANRRGLEMVAIPMIENARRQGEAVHCLFIDLDSFRTVNEVLGTDRGDGVLSAVAEALRASIRTTDVLARWSGDEFVIIGPGTGTSPLEMERRVRSRLAADPPVPLDVWKGRVSVGSATLVPWDDGDLHSLLRRADQDMALRRSLRRHSTLPRRHDLPPTSAREKPAREKGE